MRFIPQVLYDAVLVDGEQAFLLSLISQDIGFPAVPVYKTSEPRQSRMRMCGILQVSAVEALKAPLVLRVRSPFTDNPGSINKSPVVRTSWVDANNQGVVPPAAYPVDDQTPAINVSWASAGDLVPGNYFPTFNGKQIPNWAYAISFDEFTDEGSGLFIEVDFMHSIT